MLPILSSMFSRKYRSIEATASLRASLEISIVMAEAFERVLRDQACTALNRKTVELGIDRHDRECLGQCGRGDLAKTVLLIEPVRRQELCRRAGVYLAYLAGATPGEKRPQQT